MASSSSTFSSALSYALEQLGTPNLKLKEEPLKAVYQGNSVFVWLPTGFGKSIRYQALPFVIEYKKGQRVHTILLAMTTCFMYSQICRVGTVYGFCLIHMHYFFTASYFVVMEQHAFGIDAHSLFC